MDWLTLLKRINLQLLSVLLIGGLWLLISRIVSAEVVPTPLMTWRSFLRALQDNYIWSDMAITFNRTLGAFALAMSIGVINGSLLGAIRLYRRIFGSWLIIAASIPSLLYLVISYLTFGLNDTAAIVGAGLVVGPTITFNVWQGMKTLDPRLSEMARVFGVPRWIIFRRVILPQTVPFLFAAARFGLALTWKIMIFVELLGRSSGVGYRIQYWYQLFNMERVLASALPFIVLMLIIELVILRNMETYLFRWKREEAR
jgi:NitT/TauT family transport system permease protein